MIDSFFNSLPEYLDLIIGYAPTLFIIIVPIAVFVAYQKTKNETQAAKETAARLGLKYINVADEMKAEKPNDALLLGLLSKWSTWAMAGTYNSVPVRVEQIVKAKQNRRLPREGDLGMSNPSSTSYRRGAIYNVSFEKPLPFDLKIHQNIKMDFAFMKGHDADAITSGDTELDKAVVISGEDEEKIKGWIDSSQIREALKNLYNALPSVNVNTNGLHYDELNGKPDYESVKSNLDALSSAAKKLVSA